MTQTPEDKMIKLFDYWNNLEKIKVLTFEEFSKQKQDIRYTICDVLGKGIEDKHPRSGVTARRFVLNATEIKSLVEGQLGISIQKSNLYFHLQQLEEADLVKVVDIVKVYDKRSNRKKVTSYYGRTAKVFLSGGPREIKQLNLLEDERFFTLLKRLNPTLNENSAKKVIGSVANINQNDFSFFISWLNKHEKELIACDIDFRQIFDLINLLQFNDPEIFNSIIELSKLLKFNPKENN